MEGRGGGSPAPMSLIGVLSGGHLKPESLAKGGGGGCVSAGGGCDSEGGRGGGLNESN